MSTDVRDQFADLRLDEEYALVAMAPHARTERLRLLRIWVDWLVNCFDLADRIPPCWPHHDGVVERLHALFVDWVRVYCIESDQFGEPALGPLRWIEALDRHLPHLGAPSDCHLGHHHARPITTTGPWKTRHDQAPGRQDEPDRPVAPEASPMTPDDINTLITQGRAETYLDGALVRIGDAWWITDGTTYTRVTSPEMTAGIEADVARLRHAQEAARRATNGDPPVEADHP